MKRIVTLFAVAMLCATPAFAAGKAGDSAGTGKGNQKKIENVTTVDSSYIQTHQGGKTDIGVVENKGNKQEEVKNYTEVSGGSRIITGPDATAQVGVVENAGKTQKDVKNMTSVTGGSGIFTGTGGTTQAGVVENKGNKQETITNQTTINNSQILNDGQSRTGVVTNQ